MTTYRVEIEPSGNAFEVADGGKVLDAALDAGHQLPYSCRRGTCATCRCRILSGTVDYGEHLPAMLTEEMKQDGLVLLCSARALSDLRLEVEELKFGAQKPRRVPCRVKEMHRPSSDVAIVHLRLPQNEGFRHVAGQYVDILLKDGKRRSYSIANEPSVHGVIDLELHIRHTPGGLFTDHVFSDMKEREILRFEGPLGTFYLREDSDKPVIFVASGTGFAPIKAILEHAFSQDLGRDITLYWGGNRPGDLYMLDEAAAWAAEHERFEFVPVVSNASAEDDWTGRTGFVHQAVLDDHPDLSAHQIYVCGNPLMVDAARAQFSDVAGLPADQFFADPFVDERDLAAEISS